MSLPIRMDRYPSQMTFFLYSSRCQCADHRPIACNRHIDHHVIHAIPKCFRTRHRIMERTASVLWPKRLKGKFHALRDPLRILYASPTYLLHMKEEF
jgi:hypothetical protein